ncbi:PIN domain-containing protein [uncultured Arthrobacter sp.]|uniref:PIN domain-containing protein n=1 Tax=uncultured Arthrobacter sp. TaxID=114050 RepID=UPI0026290A3A|nr:type II toxin-antitoxin system VapC family toxin [uncultured Arthrobacter sp.]
MIGLDTNVIVRFLTQDDSIQSALAASLLGSLTPVQPGYISPAVLVETYWVLRRGYRLPAKDVVSALLALVSSDEILVEHADLVRTALRQALEGHDFADALIALDGVRRGCEFTATFDRHASDLEGMKLLDSA